MDRKFPEGLDKSLEDFDTRFRAYAAPEHAQCRNHLYSLPSPVQAFDGHVFCNSSTINGNTEASGIPLDC